MEIQAEGNGEEPTSSQDRAQRTLVLPVTPIRGGAVLPKAIIPLSVGRAPSLQALKSAPTGSMIGVFAQLDPEEREPPVEHLHQIGTAAVVLRIATVSHEHQVTMAFVEGVHRVRIREVLQTTPYIRVLVDVLEETGKPSEEEERALVRNIHELFDDITLLSPSLSQDMAVLARANESSSDLVDFVTASLPNISREEKQEFLETVNLRTRMRKLVAALLREREGLRLRDKIRSEIEEDLEDMHREILLRQQLEAIRSELGEDEDPGREIDELKDALAAAELPSEARREADRELQRLVRIAPGAAEYSVVTTYLDWLANLPWKAPERERIDVAHAARVLDENHCGLSKVKERILEHMSVFQLKHDIKGPILCLTGPPGVGKTSLGRSIAKAMRREFVRISLGGIHDEAEIRGHRRTYVGALPGQIIRGLRRARTRNPVFMLDEIDKLGTDFRGDPASALLEVLDPEQNTYFRDHYLGVPFDLSKVLFLTTANLLDPIPNPLRDRMEVLELLGYSVEEKLEIAENFLVARQASEHGLQLHEHLEFSRESLLSIIRGYTHEAGVRQLERAIGAICRKRAKQIVEEGPSKALIVPETVRKQLGRSIYKVGEEVEERTRAPGVAVGLAWTPYGGEVLFVEASRMLRDKGEFTITGQVRAVMQESTMAALTWLRANSPQYGIDPQRFREYDIHIHIPSGSVPKDGPSAGIVMVTAMLSRFLDRPIRPFVAMTGEITLSGRVLPVGGIKEKILAAKQSGITEVILPRENQAEFEEEISPHLREGMSFHFVDTIAEAMRLAFENLPEQRSEPSGTDGRRREMLHVPEM